MTPDKPTLAKWAKAWGAERKQAHRELVASYTPEQRAIIARRTEAARQRRLCWERWRWPEGSTGKHPTLVEWPDPPPTS